MAIKLFLTYWKGSAELFPCTKELMAFSTELLPYPTELLPCTFICCLSYYQPIRSYCQPLRSYKQPIRSYSQPLRSNCQRPHFWKFTELFPLPDIWTKMEIFAYHMKFSDKHLTWKISNFLCSKNVLFPCCWIITVDSRYRISLILYKQTAGEYMLSLHYYSEWSI